MGQNKGIIDRLAEMSKTKLILVMLGGMALLGFPLVYYGFGFDKKAPVEETGPVVIDMPDASTEEYDKSRLQTYRDADMNGMNRTNDSYWDSLGDDLVSETSRDDYLDPAVYSEMERYQIKHGLKTREQIDLEHAEEAARKSRMQQQLDGTSPYGGSYYSGGSSRRPMTQEQKDSAYFARIEKAYQLAAKYSAQDSEEPEKAPEEPKEEERKIDLGGSATANLPTDAFDGEGIVTSLVGPEESDVVHYAGTVHSKPVKATFLKNETISNGQRVIIRLMQDMTLSDGTTIPANTHITGTCTFSSRLKIDVKMLHYNGRMFPTDISVYDNDGSEGIYCPTVDDGKKKKNVAKQVAGGAIQAAGTVAGTLLTGNPFIGRVASSGLQAATSSINSDGTVSVKVTSGYEFYVFENVKKDPYGQK